MKLRDLQRECRKRDIWPGGDAPYIKDRLLRYDFARSLLLPCETRTEAQEQEELLAAQYYEVIAEPIDVETIRKKLADKEDQSFADSEARGDDLKGMDDKRKQWLPEEDLLINIFVDKFGTKKWNIIAD